MSFIAAGIAVAGAATSAIMASQAKKEAEKKESMARNEMERQKQLFSNLDTSNPYLNMENVMEDLTINQQQADFQKQQAMQSQANILQSMKGAAGGSGVASLAQAMANSGNLAAQQASATIGQQEAANQRAERAEAGRLQGMERQGDLLSRNMERDKVSTLLGMAQQETGAYRAEAAAAQQAMIGAISQGATAAAGAVSAANTANKSVEAANINAGLNPDGTAKTTTQGGSGATLLEEMVDGNYVTYNADGTVASIDTDYDLTPFDPND